MTGQGNSERRNYSEWEKGNIFVTLEGKLHIWHCKSITYRENITGSKNRNKMQTPLPPP